MTGTDHVRELCLPFVPAPHPIFHSDDYVEDQQLYQDYVGDVEKDFDLGKSLG